MDPEVEALPAQLSDQAGLCLREGALSLLELVKHRERRALQAQRERRIWQGAGGSAVGKEGERERQWADSG